jgi:general stress protein CsbA
MIAKNNRGSMEDIRLLAGWRQRELLLVLGLALASLILWRVPVLGLVSYPFRLFGTFVHEICHGLAAVLTGGEFRRFEINPDLSGVAFSAGGIRWVISSAGYVGSALFGGALMVLSARGLPPREVLMGLGIVFGLLCLLFVRNLYGIFTGIVISAVLIAAGRYLSVEWAGWLLIFLAVQLILDALNSIFDLLLISTTMRGVTTDAQIMASATGIPALVWALLWAILSGFILFWSLRIAFRE